MGALLLAIAIVIGAAVTFVGEPRFDERIVTEARDLRDGWFGQLMAWLTHVGYALWLVPASLVVSLALGLVLRRWRDALVVALATSVATVVTRVLKETFERVRPEGGVDVLVAGFSMPSGHATSSAAFATSIVLATHRGGARHRAVLTVLALLALLVGVSRVVLGAHYPSDVVAGFCSGTGVALLVAGIIGSMPPRTTSPAALD